MGDKLAELHEDLLKSKIQFKGFNILFLSQVLILDNALGAYKAWSFTNIAKKLGVENLMKSILFKASHPFLKKRITLHSDYAFINEVNNVPVMQALNLVFKNFGDERATMFYSDVRLGRPVDNVVNIFEFGSLRTLVKSIYEFITFTPTLYKNRGEFKIISKKYGIASGLLYRNVFDSILLINIVKTICEKVAVKKIILMSDVHKLSRLFVLAAKPVGIQTFVVQHGATVGDAGYLPILADKMLAWGESSKNWFVERGQPAQKIEVLGSPRMDSTRYQENQSPSNMNPWRRALVVMSEVSIERPFLEAIKDGLKKCRNEKIHIVIKLHPGGAIDYSYMPKEIFGHTGLSFDVLRHEKMSTLLDEADIVFVTTSSVGMEAIVHNKPIFHYKSPELFNHRMSYEDFDCSHLFENGDQLAKLISDPQIVNSKLLNYPRFVDYYFGKLDGNSTFRVEQFIKNYHSSN